MRIKKLAKIELELRDGLLSEHLRGLINGSMEIIEEAKIYAESKGLRIKSSHSGGIDSVVVKHLANRCGVTEAYFFNTGVEEKGNIKFIKKIKESENIEIRKPQKNMTEIYWTDGFPLGSKEMARGMNEFQVFLETGNNLLTAYKRIIGYTGMGLNQKIIKKSKYVFPMWVYELIHYRVPLTSKCCNILKKDLLKPKEDYSLTGVMASDSMLRAGTVKTHGAVKTKNATPIVYWTKKDVWDYIHHYKLDYSTHYTEGVNHSGCFNCGMGSQFDFREGRDRFTDEWETRNPKQFKAHMKKKHKSGMNFETAYKIWKRTILTPNYVLQYELKIKFILQLREQLEIQNKEYNNSLLQNELNIAIKKLRTSKQRMNKSHAKNYLHTN